MEVDVQLKSCTPTKKRREGERNSKCSVNEARRQWFKTFPPKNTLCVCVCLHVCCLNGSNKDQFVLAFSQRNSFFEPAPWFQPVKISVSDMCEGPLTSGLAGGDEHVCWEWWHLHCGRDHKNLMCKKTWKLYMVFFLLTKGLIKTLNQMYLKSGLSSTTLCSFFLGISSSAGPTLL